LQHLVGDLDIVAAISSVQLAQHREPEVIRIDLPRRRLDHAGVEIGELQVLAWFEIQPVQYGRVR
jgi:hypothetical protein